MDCLPPHCGAFLGKTHCASINPFSVANLAAFHADEGKLPSHKIRAHAKASHYDKIGFSAF